MTNRVLEDDAPSLPLTLVDALVFWLRNQFVFWLTALPIAGLGAGVTYVLQADRQFIDWRDHWGWDFLFVLIYAMFLDRWIKESLLEDASPCDEVDELRRSTVAVRFLTFAAVLGGHERGGTGEPEAQTTLVVGHDLLDHVDLILLGQSACEAIPGIEHGGCEVVVHADDLVAFFETHLKCLSKVSLGHTIEKAPLRTTGFTGLPF